MKKYIYDAILHELSDNGGAYVIFPWDIRKKFGKPYFFNVINSIE